ncbi:hypothetical protein ACQKGC_08505 [Allorhizobium pseudoryzae]|jgi:hypothetical protein|uniref:hypothetical protein n=1 Tax=Allorhizobium pseudoryzae TaxID=379684 RepID=UPI0013EADEBD|nr:hypothetical protein [Allorhizobium pseudoryzae]
MSKVVVLGISGEASLWFVDLENLTVSQVADPVEGELGKAVALRSAGAVVSKGVDFAVAVSSMEDIAQGHFEG